MYGAPPNGHWVARLGVTVICWLLALAARIHSSVCESRMRAFHGLTEISVWLGPAHLAFTVTSTACCPLLPLLPEPSMLQPDRSTTAGMSMRDTGRTGVSPSGKAGRAVTRRPLGARGRR